MNYSTLFPNILKQLPKIKEENFSYNYSENNYNNNNKSKFFIPCGKNMLLWFLEYNSNYYSILLEEKNNKIEKCHFQYLSFKPLLTTGCGTIYYVTKINNQLSLNKIIYFKGEQYNNKYIIDHIKDIKFILDNYINQLSSDLFLQLKIPVINNNNNYIYQSSILPYNVYNILSSNNFPIYIKEYLATFIIKLIDYNNDIYKLYINNDLYTNAFVNDIKTSIFLKNLFNIPYKTQENIE